MSFTLHDHYLVRQYLEIGAKCKIISVYRELVAHTISAFFQTKTFSNKHLFFPNQIFPYLLSGKSPTFSFSQAPEKKIAGQRNFGSIPTIFVIL
ncbi:hypothetical protein AFK68_06055 [Hydrocoleum sp. CS-953]|nr:hypothetical protein AFK68_06055 [Hydrocoleum sp. CS-953]